MSKIKLYIRFFCLIGLLVCTVFATGGCKCVKDKTNGEDSNIIDMPEEVTEQKLFLNKDECNLIVGDEFTLLAYCSLSDGGTLSWQSSNESVAKVNDGLISALMPGDAEISASYNGNTAKCKVNVSFNNMYPVINFENDVSEILFTNIFEKVNFSANVSFNGKLFDDGSFTYTLSESSVGSISENGIFSPSKLGETDINVEMRWRGFVVNKTIKLQVVSKKTVLLNDGSTTEITLFSKGEFNGQYYKNEEIIKIDATENGVEKDYSLELIDNDGTVAYDESETKITALKGGSATLKVSFLSDDGSIFTQTFPIRVKKHHFTATVPLFSVLDGEAKGNTTIRGILGEDTLLFAYSNGQQLDIREGYKIFGLASSSDGMSRVTVDAESDCFVYSLELETYTKVLTKATDFVEAFNVNDAIYGYYYLANDIDPKNGTIYESVKMTKDAISTKAFRGVFDGAGHTVNLELQTRNGLFTYLYGATIKNAKFNLKMSNDAGTMNSGLAFYSFGKNYLSDVYVNVENLSSNCTNFGAVSVFYNGIIGYTRVVIETPNDKELAGYNTANMGALAMRINYTKADGTDGVTHADLFSSDVFVISPLPLARQAVGGEPWTIYARNKMQDTNNDGEITVADIDAENKITFFAQKEGAGKGRMYSFDSFDEMRSARIDLSVYNDSLFWNTANGIPLWNVQESEIESNEYLPFNEDWLNL